MKLHFPFHAPLDQFWRDGLEFFPVAVRPSVAGDEALDGDSVADYPPEGLGSFVSAVLAAEKYFIP